MQIHTLPKLTYTSRQRQSNVTSDPTLLLRVFFFFYVAGINVVNM